MAGAGPARAQLLDRYFQSAVPSFDIQYGLTETPKAQQGETQPVVHIEGLSIMADLDESIGTDTDVEGLPHGPGTAFLETAPSLSIAASGPRGRFGLDLTLDDIRYFELPQQDRTNWTISLGTSYALGRDTLVLGYAHLDEHEIATDLASPAASAAIPFVSDDFRALYQTTLGRLALTPNAEFTTFRYQDEGSGAGAAQSLDDRNVTTAGVTALYPFGTAQDAVLAVQDVETDYLRATPGIGSFSSNSWLLLAGIDQKSAGPWRYRLLAGVEQRNFADGSLLPVTTPIAAASVTWQPEPLTSLTASVTRQIDDAASAGVGSYTYTDGELSVERVLRHDLLLQGRTDVQVAEYNTGGTQSSYGAGASLVWTLSPRLRVRLDYNYRYEGTVSGPVSAYVSGGFSQNRAIVSLRLAL